MGWLKRITDEGKNIGLMGVAPAYHNFMLFGNKNDEEVGLPEIWRENGHKNIKWLDKNKDRIIGSIYDLPDFKDKAVIIVGASPVLNKSWEMLKDADDNFIIVATNSSAKYLVDRDIIPDYVIAIDGRAGEWTLDLGEKCKDVVGIFSACVCPQVLDDWPGKIMIVPYGVKDRSLKGKIERRWGKGIVSGGNSFNSVFAIFAFHTKAKIFLFAGNELSFKKQYYADRKSPNDEQAYFFTKNIYGEKVRTFIPLFEYKVWLENIMAQLYPEYHFCNCSEGILGVDVDGELLHFINHKPLDIAIAEVKEALSFQKEDLNTKLEFMYGQFYEHDYGNIKRGISIWQYVIDHFPFTKGLDVGCGRANGIEHARNQGYDVYGCDIASSARRCWKDRGVDKYCEVCPAKDMPFKDNEFDMIVCSEVMEHIPEHDVIPTFKEIFRVGSDKFLFTICLKEEKAPLAGYIQTHITVKNHEWWFERFAEAGFNLAAASHNADMTDITVLLTKESQEKTETPLFVLGSGKESSQEWRESV